MKPLPALVCKVCRAWWPWPSFSDAPSPEGCSHEWPERYATGDGGRLEAIKRGYVENGPTQASLF